MPSVKDFKNKQEATRPKRRPGREEPEVSEAQVKVVDVEEGVREENASETLHEAHTHHEKVEHRHSRSRAAASGASGVEDGAGSGASIDNSDSHKTFGEPESFEAQPEGPKVEIRFFGSELLRAKAPQPFDIAEAVATDWVNNGNFEKLPIKHPLAQFAAQKGLQKAKEIEKKVMESPVTEKVAMQVLTAGMKAQGLIEQLRSKIKK